MKLLGKNTGENLNDIGFGSDSVGYDPISRSNQEKVDKLDLIKTKNFYELQDTLKKAKR